MSSLVFSDMAMFYLTAQIKICLGKLSSDQVGEAIDVLTKTLAVNDERPIRGVVRHRRSSLQSPISIVLFIDHVVEPDFLAANMNCWA